MERLTCDFEHFRIDQHTFFSQINQLGYGPSKIFTFVFTRWENQKQNALIPT